MKKWSLIMALLLCLIALGGLTVLFNEKPLQEDIGNQDSIIETPVDGEEDNIQAGEIVLNENRLIF